MTIESLARALYDAQFDWLQDKVFGVVAAPDFEMVRPVFERMARAVIEEMKKGQVR